MTSFCDVTLRLNIRNTPWWWMTYSNLYKSTNQEVMTRLAWTAQRLGGKGAEDRRCILVCISLVVKSLI